MKRLAPNQQPPSQPHAQRRTRAGVHTTTGLRAGGLVGSRNPHTLLPKDFQSEEKSHFWRWIFG